MSAASGGLTPGSGLSPDALEAKRLAEAAEAARKAESEEDRKKRLDSEKAVIDKYLEEKRKKAANPTSTGDEAEAKEEVQETESTVNTAINAMRASTDPEIQKIATTPVAEWPIGEAPSEGVRTLQEATFAEKFEEEVKKAKEELKVEVNPEAAKPKDRNSDPEKPKKAPSVTAEKKKEVHPPHAGGPEESAGYKAQGMFDKFFGYVEDFARSWVMQFVYYAIAKVVISAWSVVSGITQTILGTVAANAGLLFGKPGWKDWGGDIAKRGTTLDGTVMYFVNIAQFVFSALTLNPDGMKAASIAARESFNNSIIAKVQNLFGPLISKGFATVEIGLGGMVANTLMGNFRGAWNSFSGIFYAKETSERQPGLWQLLGATALDPFGHLPVTSLLGGTIVHAHGVEMLIVGEPETTVNKRTRIRGLIEYLDPSFKDNLVFYYDRASRRGVLDENDPSGAAKDIGNAIKYPKATLTADTLKSLANILASPFGFKPFQTSYEKHAEENADKQNGKANAAVGVEEVDAPATLTNLTSIGAEEEVAGPPKTATVFAEEESNPSAMKTNTVGGVSAKVTPKSFPGLSTINASILEKTLEETQQPLPLRIKAAVKSTAPVSHAEAKGYFSTFRGYTTIPLYNFVISRCAGLFREAQKQNMVSVNEEIPAPAPATSSVSAKAKQRE